MKLVIGLGNPGSRYDNTRHNVGFMALDLYCKQNNINFKLKSNFKGAIATSNKVIFLKPTTYMNLSGESVKSVMKFYNIDIKDIIVIIDDLSLPTGKVRIREGGSSGGHNGLKSINQHLSSENYARIKIGIDRSDVIPVSDYVLGKFTKNEMVLIEEALDNIIPVLDDFINGVNLNQICSTRN